jgi:hypothetical protein
MVLTAVSIRWVQVVHGTDMVVAAADTAILLLPHGQGWSHQHSTQQGGKCG